MALEASPAAAPEVQPALDSGPQAPGAVDERAEDEFQNLISARNEDSCMKQAPYSTRKAAQPSGGGAVSCF
jgi:hypothetical protein